MHALYKRKYTFLFKQNVIVFTAINLYFDKKTIYIQTIETIIVIHKSKYLMK